MSKNESEFSNTAVNIRQLVEAMNFSEEGVTAAILEQPKLFLQASRYKIEKMRTRVKAESELDQLRLETAALIRTRDADKENVKVTEKYIEEQTSKNPKVRAAIAKYDEAYVMEEWAKLLLDSFRERGSMLKAVVQLLGAEAAVESRFVHAELERMGVDRLSEKVRSRFPKGQED